MEFHNSKSISIPLVANIVAQNYTYDNDQDKIEEIKKEIHASKIEQQWKKIEEIKESLNWAILFHMLFSLYIKVHFRMLSALDTSELYQITLKLVLVARYLMLTMPWFAPKEVSLPYVKMRWETW